MGQLLALDPRVGADSGLLCARLGAGSGLRRRVHRRLVATTGSGPSPGLGEVSAVWLLISLAGASLSRFVAELLPKCCGHHHQGVIGAVAAQAFARRSIDARPLAGGLGGLLPDADVLIARLQIHCSRWVSPPLHALHRLCASGGAHRWEPGLAPHPFWSLGARSSTCAHRLGIMGP